MSEKLFMIAFKPGYTNVFGQKDSEGNRKCALYEPLALPFTGSKDSEGNWKCALYEPLPFTGSNYALFIQLRKCNCLL